MFSIERDVMIESRPSITAQRVALRRAAHQVLDNPRVFEDPLALRIAESDERQLRDAEPRGDRSVGSRALRAFIAARSRYAEDELARAVARGVRQYVILGAGLDTFAYRNPHCDYSLRVFEVDHPSTQAWKRERLQTAGIRVPPLVSFVPVDFEHETLSGRLGDAGFRIGEMAFFGWLGVTPYLTHTAFSSTLSFMASAPAGSGVVFDYAVARSALNYFERAILDALAHRVARAGEPFRLFFEPQDLAVQLRKLGFEHVEDLGAAEINMRYFSGRADGLGVRGALGRLVSAQL